MKRCDGAEDKDLVDLEGTVMRTLRTLYVKRGVPAELLAAGLGGGAGGGGGEEFLNAIKKGKNAMETLARALQRHPFFEPYRALAKVLMPVAGSPSASPSAAASPSSLSFSLPLRGTRSHTIASSPRGPAGLLDAASSGPESSEGEGGYGGGRGYHSTSDTDTDDSGALSGGDGGGNLSDGEISRTGGYGRAIRLVSNRIQALRRYKRWRRNARGWAKAGMAKLGALDYSDGVAEYTLAL